jgi:hypothetical protein
VDAGSNSTPSLPFTVNSKITLNPTAGSSGDTVAVTGDGFAALAAVTIQVDGTAVTTNPATVTSSAAGHFSASITMPSVVRGPHIITASDSVGSTTATFSVGQRITITPTSGVQGAPITINGSGFSPNKTITVTVGGAAATTTPATITSDINGNFSSSFAIPGVAAGTRVVSATDSDNNVANANITVIAQITITPTSGTVGTQITATG